MLETLESSKDLSRFQMYLWPETLKKLTGENEMNFQQPKIYVVVFFIHTMKTK